MRFIFVLLLVVPALSVMAQELEPNSCVEKVQSLAKEIRRQACGDVKGCNSNLGDSVQRLYENTLRRSWDPLAPVPEQLIPVEPLISNDYREAIFLLNNVSRTFPLEDVRLHLQNINAKRLPLEETYRTLGPLTPRREADKKRDFILKSLRGLAKDPRFIEAVAILDHFYSVAFTCDQIARYLGLPCDESIGRKEILRIVQEFRDGSRKLQESAIKVMWDVLSRSDGLLLRRNPLLQVEIERGDVWERLSFVVRIRRGMGFKTDREWRRFLSDFKRENEQFWRGTFRRESDQKEIIVTIEIEEAKEAKGAIRIDYDPWAKYSKTNRIAGDWITFNRIIHDGSLRNAVLVHEFGHVLGFADHYYYFLDGRNCAFGYHQIATDIMSRHPAATNTVKNLLWLYKAYGQEKSENDDDLFVKIEGLERDAFEITRSNP